MKDHDDQTSSCRPCIAQNQTVPHRRSLCEQQQQIDRADVPHRHDLLTIDLDGRHPKTLKQHKF